MSTKREETVWLYKVKDLMTGDLAKLSERMDRLENKMKALDRTTQKTFKDGSHAVKGFSLEKNKLMSGMSSEIPMLDRFGVALANPYVLAGAAIAGLGAILFKSEQKAEAYNNQFLELENLNLDKTQGQLDRLNKSILDVSFEKGLNPEKTAKSFFDLQSATGKYGKEVEVISGRVGEFSKSVKADQDEMINAVGKAMNAYQFGADKIDKFLQSQAKTVQVGVTTFDQLAKSQVEYGSAASGAGQSFDEANKFFAAFTKTSKSVDIAATMTKTAFMGLADPKVQEGLKAYNINVFDASGKMKDTSKIVEDINSKISKFSDQKFSKFMGDVGGPEGMKGLLQMIKSQGDSLLQTFSDFDKLDFNIDKVLANAKKDPKIMREMVQNRIENLQVRVGQLLIEPVVKGMDFISSKLAQGLKLWEEMSAEGGNFKQVFEDLKPIATTIWEIFTLQFRVSRKISELWFKFGKESALLKDTVHLIGEGFKLTGQGIEKMFEGISWWIDNTIIKPLEKLEKFYLKVTGKEGEVNMRRNDRDLEDAAKYMLGQERYDLLQDPAVLKKMSSEFGFKNRGDIAKLLTQGKGGEMKNWLSGLMGKPGEATDKPLGSTLGTELDNKVSSITDGGKTARHITVNIDKLVENIYNQVTNVKKGMDNAAEIIKAGLIETVRDTEIALGNSI